MFLLCSESLEERELSGVSADKPVGPAPTISTPLSFWFARAILKMPDQLLFSACHPKRPSDRQSVE